MREKKKNVGNILRQIEREREREREKKKKGADATLISYWSRVKFFSKWYAE